MDNQSTELSAQNGLPVTDLGLLQKELADKNVLLSLSRDITKIRAKTDLARLIREKLSQLFYFYHCTITIVCDDKITFKALVLDPNSKIKIHSDYIPLIRKPHLLANGIDDVVLQSEHPVLLDLDELNIARTLPFTTKIIHEAGIREAVGATLSIEQERFGIIWFFSDHKNSFTANDLTLIENVANLIAPAVANILALEAIEQKVKEREDLLSISDDIARVKNRNDLLEVINLRLKKLFPFTYSLILSLSDDQQYLTAFLLDPASQSRVDPNYDQIVSQRLSVDEGLFTTLLESREPVILDIEKEASQPTAPDYIKMNDKAGLKELAAVVLRASDQQPFGILGFYSNLKGGFDANSLALIQGISYHLSTAIANILFNEDIQNREYENKILLEISNEIVGVKTKYDLLTIISNTLKKHVNFDDSYLFIYDRQNKKYSSYVDHSLDNNLHNFTYLTLPNYIIPEKNELPDYSHRPIIVDVEMLLHLGIEWGNAIYKMGIREFIRIKLTDGDEIIGLFLLLSDRKNAFTPTSINLLQKISFQISKAMANLLANEKIERQLVEINQYKQQLEEEKLYLQAEISSGYSYTDIVGSGIEMQKVFHLLSQVAFANTTVLILGETGTGKELIARALHNGSPRKDKLMVKVNCAALPPNLIESELFGHEKGAFTGATDRRIGKFELANGGTLFLDEIGEMPLELQVKLLRALQEKEIERVGGKTTLKVDVRIIAATNRDLHKEVAEGRFRRDLFYRLNIFPITLPPLRERKEDLPVLVAHFIEKFEKNTGKKVEHISNKAMKELMAYNWPGNVRELEHLIERSVLMATGNTLKELHLPTVNRKELKLALKNDYLKTLEENERDYILAVLEQCNGKIFGPGGAATILDLPVSTLNSRMKKLGIGKEKPIFKRPTDK